MLHFVWYIESTFCNILWSYTLSFVTVVLYLKHNLNQHVATVHEERKIIQLWSLSLQIFSKKWLKRHVSWVQDGKKPFKYEVCDYRSSRKGDLNKHIASVYEVNKLFKYDMTAVLKRVTVIKMLNWSMKEKTVQMWNLWPWIPSKESHY